MKCFLLLFILIFGLFSPKSQILGSDIPNTPFLKNYTKRDYQARTQNWNIVQGLNNVMYFANNQGVLQFDGVDWNLVEMPNRSIVRTLNHLSGDTLLVGAYSEFGITYHDKYGKLVYQSWLNKLPHEYRNFNEIWRIHKIGEHIIFQSFTHILIFKNDKFVKAIVPENGFMFSYLVNGTLYVQTLKMGLFKLQDNELILINSDKIFKELELWAILPFDEKNILIGTQFNGFYLFDGLVITPWNNEANEFIKKNNLFSSLLLSNGNYAFGSIQNGMIVTNKKGKILTIQNSSIGLQNNTVLSLFEDNTHNLWLGLDNGIDFLKINSPLSYVRKRGGFGMGYVSLIFNNRLYAGTNQGLFSISLTSNNETIENIADFEIVESTRGQVWCLRNIDNTLYCGHNFGLFILHDDKATKVDGINGVWDVLEIPGNSENLLIGTYDGFYILNKQNKIPQKIEGFNESARHNIFLENGNILVGHGYKGVYEIKLDIKNKSITVINFFNGKNQLPNDFGNEVFKFNNGVVILTDTGIYNFNAGKIEYSKLWDKFFEEGSKGISNIIETGDSRFWCFKDGKLNFFTFLNDNMFEIYTKDFLSINNTFPNGFENILKINTDNYLIGNEDGFVLYENKGTNAAKEKIILDISSVQCLQKGESNYTHLEFKKVENEIQIGNLSYSKHRLKIVISSPFYTDQNLVQYRYRINNGPWLEWSTGNEFKLDDLREGAYLIDVQCTVDTKNIADQIALKFTIDPPFFRRWYSYVFYLMLFFTLALISSALIKKRIENEKRREALKQKRHMIKKQIKFERDAELAQSELITLRNEKLITDIRHKSKELANTTMSLINKNKILQQFKDVLVDIKKEDVRYRENNKINNLIRKINKEIEHQDNWVVFEENFDKVHENFLQRLKANHSDLTPKDLRLAAYLRMNLSSKEIAPLLNISIRSVEISRYRLRKKMDLGHDQNLTEYIIST